GVTPAGALAHARPALARSMPLLARHRNPDRATRRRACERSVSGRAGAVIAIVSAVHYSSRRRPRAAATTSRGAGRHLERKRYRVLTQGYPGTMVTRRGGCCSRRRASRSRVPREDTMAAGQPRLYTTCADLEIGLNTWSMGGGTNYAVNVRYMPDD